MLCVLFVGCCWLGFILVCGDRWLGCGWDNCLIVMVWLGWWCCRCGYLWGLYFFRYVGCGVFVLV